MLKLIPLLTAALLWTAPFAAQAAPAPAAPGETLRGAIQEIKHDRRSHWRPPGHHYRKRHAAPSRHSWRRGGPPVRHYRPRPRPAPRYYYKPPRHYYYPAPGMLHFHLTIPN